MRCETAQRRLPEFADGALPAAEHAALTEHLAGCSGCREERRLLTEVGADLEHLVRKRRRRSVPEAVTHRWKAALLHREGAGGQRPRSGYLFGGAAAACLVAAVLLVGSPVLPGSGDAGAARQALLQPVTEAVTPGVSPRVSRTGLVGRIDETVRRDDVELSIQTVFGDDSQTLLVMELRGDGSEMDPSANGVVLADEWGSHYTPETVTWQEMPEPESLVGMLRFEPLEHRTRYLLIDIVEVAGRHMPVRVKTAVSFTDRPPVPEGNP